MTEQVKTDYGAVIRKIYKGKTASLIKSEDNGSDLLRIPISSTADDRDQDNFSVEGLEDMVNQIESGQIPMFLDHGMHEYRVLDILGAFTNAYIENNVLYADAKLDEQDDRVKELKRKTDQGLPIGFSVAFIPLDYKQKENGGTIFNKVDLLEVSAVGIPCNSGMINPHGRNVMQEQISMMIKSMFNKEMKHMEKDEKEKDEGEQMEQDPDDEDDQEDDQLEQAIKLIAELYSVTEEQVVDLLSTLEMEDEDDDTEDDGCDEDDDKSVDLEMLNKKLDEISERLEKAEEQMDLIQEKKKDLEKKKRQAGTPKTIVLPDQDQEKKGVEQEKERTFRFNPNY